MSRQQDDALCGQQVFMAEPCIMARIRADAFRRRRRRPASSPGPGRVERQDSNQVGPPLDNQRRCDGSKPAEQCGSDRGLRRQPWPISGGATLLCHWTTCWAPCARPASPHPRTGHLAVGRRPRRRRRPRKRTGRCRGRLGRCARRLGIGGDLRCAGPAAHWQPQPKGCEPRRAGLDAGLAAMQVNNRAHDRQPQSA